MASQRAVLIVDDDAPMRDMLASLLEEGGIRCAAAASADEALERIEEAEFDAVISDIRMPAKDGVEFMGELRGLRPDTPVILMTAFGSIDAAVDAMRAGAFDYITKPFKRDAILASLERAFERRALELENRQLRRALDRSSSFGDLIGASPAAGPAGASRAPMRWPRWWWSIRRLRRAVRARIRRPTPARSRPFGSCSPACPKPECGATLPAASPST